MKERKKLTFADVLDKPFTIYDVNTRGKIKKAENVRLVKRTIKDAKTNEITHEYSLSLSDVWKHGIFMTIKSQDELNKPTFALNPKGEIMTSWGHAVFLDKKDAQKKALEIINVKYKNALNRIKNI
jgi:hypothetical protein